MDLSLLSDAEIRAVDALISGVWHAGMYVTLGAVPAHGVFAYSERGVTIRSQGCPIEYQVTPGCGWSTRDRTCIPQSRPASVAEAFDAWCQLIAGHVRHLRSCLGPPRPAPYAVCRVVLERYVDVECAWVIHDTVAEDSVKRVRRVINFPEDEKEEDASTDGE
jgi:hypothetical protein